MACSTWSPHFASIELELLDFRQKDQDGVGKFFGDPIRRRFALGQPQLREPSGALAPATALFERAHDACLSSGLPLAPCSSQDPHLDVGQTPVYHWPRPDDRPPPQSVRPCRARAKSHRNRIGGARGKFGGKSRGTRAAGAASTGPQQLRTRGRPGASRVAEATRDQMSQLDVEFLMALLPETTCHVLVVQRRPLCD